MIFENHGRQELPAQDERVESGVVRFDGDWPGLFIRGDDCMNIGLALANVMEWLEANADTGLLRQISQSVGVVGELRMALGLVVVNTLTLPSPAGEGSEAER